MILSLNELENHIYWGYNNILDTETGAYRHVEARDLEFAKDTLKKSEIVLPSITYEERCALYVHAMPDSEMKTNLLGVMRDSSRPGAVPGSFGEIFHVTIEDAGEAFKWAEFDDDTTRNIAKTWCEEHNLAYALDEEIIELEFLEKQLEELQAQGHIPRINKNLKVDLRELIQYMQSGINEAVLNVDTGECRLPFFCLDENEALVPPEMRCNEIIMPKIDSGAILHAFLQQLGNETIRDDLRSKIGGKKFWHIFHKTLLAENCSADWDRFCEEKELDFARTWCEEIGIGYHELS